MFPIHDFRLNKQSRESKQDKRKHSPNGHRLEAGLERDTILNIRN